MCLWRCLVRIMAHKLLTFKGHTPAEVLKVVKNRYGEHALIVDTKEIAKRGLGSQGLVEVQVAIDEEILKEIEGRDPGTQERTIDLREEQSESSQNSIARRLEDIAKKEMERKSSIESGIKNSLAGKGMNNIEDVSLQLSDAVRQISKIANVGENEQERQSNKQQPRREEHPQERRLASEREIETRVPLQKKQGEFSELKSITGEIKKLNDKIKLMQNMLWDERGPKKEGLIIPHEFAEIYRMVKQSGMYKEHVDKIMQLTVELMPVKMRENSTIIKRYFREVMRKMIFSRRETEPNSGQRIMMLVGPTGVGKTTTLAKLAARYSLNRDKNYKVGIITLDTYRIGAVDQLMFYAKKMKLSIDPVVDPPEFVSAINSLKHCDYILVDTVGSSQYDKEKIDMIKSYLNSETHLNIDVSLVVSAGSKYEDLRDIYQTYSILDIDTMIITKLDETKGFGNIFSLIYETKKPLSYLSIGQEVPDDLMVASSEYLVDCLLDGFKKVRR